MMDQQIALSPSASSLRLLLDEDELEIMLEAEANSSLSVHLRPRWHRVLPKPGTSISLQGKIDGAVCVRLTVQSRAQGWQARWVRWTYAVRRVPDIQGGSAVSAQDVLRDDEQELRLLILPGETRHARLEFVVCLDAQTEAGDYPFDVVTQDEDTGEICTTAGMLRLRHPDATFLKYLPALFTQHPDNNLPGYNDPPFLDRFLCGFEDAHQPMQEILDNIERYFDADMAPAEFLPWLATWVSLALDENWPELKRRRLIQEAVELYRWRGTRRGLSRYLHLYTGVIPQINDQPFSGMRLGPSTRLGGSHTLLGDVPPHTFVLTLAVPDVNAIKEQTVRDIIDSEKPAHTAYDLRIVQSDASKS